MLRYFSKVAKNSSLSSASSEKSVQEHVQEDLYNISVDEIPMDNINETPQTVEANDDLPELPSNPGKRLKITDYHPNIRERVRRKYYSEGPCQPNLQSFPQRKFDVKMRRFNRSWFTEFVWLEYSINRDSAYCLCCYLFKNELGHQRGDAFVSEGFRDWKNKDKLHRHVGGSGSSHRQAVSKCVDLLNQKQHIETVFVKMTDEAKIVYKMRLIASVECVRWLLKQGLAFRGHDESDESNNQGNFLELLKLLANHNEVIRKVALKNAPANLQLTSPRIQKDIVKPCAYETTKAIIDEVGDGYFSVLLDDARDVSIKEQMAVVLRFVDRKGCVVERILGIKHVKCTKAISLKSALEDLLNLHGLNISMLRGQCYDGASNMKGEFKV